MIFRSAILRRFLLVGALGFFLPGLGSPALAQDVPAGDVPATSTVPTGPMANGSSNYQNAPVNTILDLYEQLSGLHLIRDVNLNGVPPISLNATGLNKADMLKMIKESLLLNGVAIVPVDDRNVKVITVGTNKNPRSEGIKVYANAVDLPNDDEVVSYYMPLNYISPAEAVPIFTQTAPVHTYGAYVPAQSAQAVILTENVGVIRELIALKELIDVPPASVTTESIQLNRADAEKVADTLNKMLGQSAGTAGATPTAAGPNGAVIVPSGLGNTQPLSNERNLISGTAQITADTRENRLFIITRPVNLPFLEKLVGQLDQPDIFLTPQRRPLKYVLAQDILPALEAALAQGKDEVAQAQKDETTTRAVSPNSPQGTTAPVSTAGAASGGTGSVTAITPQLQSPSENNAPTVLTLGNTRLMADNRSNSIIVFGSPDIVSRCFDMIDELDRKPLQVYLGTVIGQLSVTEGLEFGIDILQKFQRVGSSGLATSNLNTSHVGTGFVPEPSSLVSSTGFPLPTGLTLYGAIGSTLDAYVRALETTDRFKVISRPSVYTTNNKLAVIASGSQVPVPSSITSGFTGGTTDLTTTASVQYENVLLQLDIIPLINANHEVTLKIRQTNNSLGANNVISGNNVPTILTQEINTEITVPNKSTVVIGGLISDSVRRDTSGVPFLSDIPILGYLFKDTTKNKDREELIIMIQPTVVETDADQLAVNEAEKQRTILGREAIEAANGVTQPLPDVISSTTTTPPVAPSVATEPLTVVAPVVDEKEVRATNYNSKTGTTYHTVTHSVPTATTTTQARTPAGGTTSATTVVTPVGTHTYTPPSLGPQTPSGPVPSLSSPAPDVSNGQMPKYSPGPIQPSTTP